MVMTGGRVNTTGIEENVGRGFEASNGVLWKYSRLLEMEEGEVRDGGMVAAVEFKKIEAETKMAAEEDVVKGEKKKTLECKKETYRPKPKPPWANPKNKPQPEPTSYPNNIIHFFTQPRAEHKCYRPEPNNQRLNNPKPEPKPPWIQHHPTRPNHIPNSKSQTLNNFNQKSCKAAVAVKDNRKPCQNYSLRTPLDRNNEAEGRDNTKEGVLQEEEKTEEDEIKSEREGRWRNTNLKENKEWKSVEKHPKRMAEFKVIMMSKDLSVPAFVTRSMTGTMIGTDSDEEKNKVVRGPKGADAVLKKFKHAVGWLAVVEEAIERNLVMKIEEEKWIDRADKRMDTEVEEGKKMIMLTIRGASSLPTEYPINSLIPLTSLMFSL